MSTKNKNYERLNTSETSATSKGNSADSTTSSSMYRKENRFMKSMMDMWHWLKKSAWVIWVHFGVMFFKVSVFLALFYTPRQLDTNDAITIATCFAFMDFVIHSVFNHQHLMFNLTAGVVISTRKLIVGPLDGTGKDAYGNDTTKMASRFNTFIRDMLNMTALVLASYLAALFNITVVFPRKSEDQDWKFISHTRDGLSSSEVFGVAFVGFFFMAWMLKQMHYRIQTDISNTASGVSCDIDCALNNNQSALVASISFVSVFWLFVSLHAPNNMGVSLGPAIVSGDYNNLFGLFSAEILAWTGLEIAFTLYAHYNHNRRKKDSSTPRNDNPSSTTSKFSLSPMNQKSTSAYGDHHLNSHNTVHVTKF